MIRGILDQLDKQHCVGILRTLQPAALRRGVPRRLDTYLPYPKQAEFHAAGAAHRERLFMAGNQLGKTLAGAAEEAIHATGRYPSWWRGRRFDSATHSWAAGVTGESTRDNVQRLLMGALKRFWSRINPAVVSGGSANAYTYTPVNPSFPTAYVVGERYALRASFANSGPATLDVNSLGAKSIKKIGGAGKIALDRGDIQNGQIVELVYDGTHLVLAGTPSMGVPSGTVVPFAGSSAPNDWLLCAGQAVSRTTYATLFAVIGTTFGTGDGSTTFNVPDLRGRAVFGKDDMNGAAANRVTTGVSGVSGITLGASGGDQRLHAHAHTYNFPGAVGPITGSLGTQYGWDGGAVVNTGTGGGGGSQNMPPALVLNYIVKA